MKMRTGALAFAAYCLGGVATVVAGSEAWRHLLIDGYEVRWQRPANLMQPLLITWRIADTNESYPAAQNCQRLQSPAPLIANSHLQTSAFHDEVSAAFAMWQNAVNIQFVEASTGTAASIVLGAQADPVGRAFADIAYDRSSTGSVRAISRSLICLNPRVAWKIGFDGNLDVYDLRYAIAHEIGHAIGLDHPERGRGTLMDFRYEERSRDLQAGDIDGAVRIYGHAQQIP